MIIYVMTEFINSFAFCFLLFFFLFSTSQKCQTQIFKNVFFELIKIEKLSLVTPK